MIRPINLDQPPTEACTQPTGTNRPTSRAHLTANRDQPANEPGPIGRPPGATKRTTMKRTDPSIGTRAASKPEPNGQVTVKRLQCNRGQRANKPEPAGQPTGQNRPTNLEPLTKEPEPNGQTSGTHIKRPRMRGGRTYVYEIRDEGWDRGRVSCEVRKRAERKRWRMRMRKLNSIGNVVERRWEAAEEGEERSGDDRVHHVRAGNTTE